MSATQTLGTWGGNFYVTPGLGFLYNDKLDSYASDPDEYGARFPNARHGSTLAPTIVFHGDGVTRRPVLAVAAAGNSWITSAVYSVVTGVLDQHLDAQRARSSYRAFSLNGNQLMQKATMSSRSKTVSRPMYCATSVQWDTCFNAFRCPVNYAWGMRRL